MANKKTIAAIVVMGALFIVTSITILLLVKNNEGSFEHNGVTYSKDEERWINCMPGPSIDPEHDELCRKAAAANYPYIAY